MSPADLPSAVPLLSWIPAEAAPWVALAAVSAATFVSEDLTCIAVGLLWHEGRIDPAVGLAGCFAGILLGDMALWAAGRAAGRPILQTEWVRRRLPEGSAGRLGEWLADQGWRAVAAARFVPGLRLPVYVAAGALSGGNGTREGGRFLVWAALAGLVWTPLLVLSVAALGPTVVEPLTAALGSGWWALAAAVLVALAGLRVIGWLGRLASPLGRARAWAAVSRIWRWEFWPAWVFYAPLVPWYVWLAIRHRGLLVWTAANPGIPHGGVVGESKHAILSALPPEWTLPSVLIAPGEPPVRAAAVAEALARHGWTLPVILKPDAGQRGSGVKLARTQADVDAYIRDRPEAFLVQRYHPGPFEAGIFYVRIPGEPTGRIFSITDKVFPEVTGDGRSTLAELVWAHPRHRMQAATFLARHAALADRVLPAGEVLRLGIAGNHCQGTLFRDGSHLWTPELERTVEAIACGFPGFCFGRFDVRYSDADAFRAGRDLAVVELNGVTSESTNLYDPSRSLVWAYGVLMRQWELLFRIGAANVRLGHRAATVGDLLRLLRDERHRPRTDPLAD
jgi:membrane protein DedA with SNARE-associated domain